jgi:hypothetical protein
MKKLSSTKVCKKCKEDKTIDVFAKLGNGKTRPLCKPCYNAVLREERKNKKNGTTSKQKTTSRDEEELEEEPHSSRNQTNSQLVIQPGTIKQFEISAFGLDCTPDFPSIKAHVISKMYIFLNNKRNFQSTPNTQILITDVKGRRGIYNVCLPEGIAFTQEEVDQFDNTIIKQVHIEMANKITIFMGRELFGATKIKKFFQRSINGIVECPPIESMKIFIDEHEEHEITIEWNESHSISIVNLEHVTTYFKNIVQKRTTSFSNKRCLKTINKDIKDTADRIKDIKDTVERIKELPTVEQLLKILSIKVEECLKAPTTQLVPVETPAPSVIHVAEVSPSIVEDDNMAYPDSEELSDQEIKYKFADEGRQSTPVNDGYDSLDDEPLVEDLNIKLDIKQSVMDPPMRKPVYESEPSMIENGFDDIMSYLHDVPQHSDNKEKPILKPKKSIHNSDTEEESNDNDRPWYKERPDLRKKYDNDDKIKEFKNQQLANKHHMAEKATPSELKYV